MRAVFMRHAGKILFAFAVGIYAAAYWLDEMSPWVIECQRVGGKYYYSECWVPLHPKSKS